MLGCEIVEKSKIAFRARAPGRRNPHSSSSPGKPDTWQRGVGDPRLERGGMRNANCRDAPRHLQSKDRATGEPDDAKVSSPVRRGADGKGRSRLPVTADAYGLTNPGIRRNLASRLPYEDSWKLETFQMEPCG